MSTKTFSDLCDEWVDSKGLTPKTAKDYKWRLARVSGTLGNPPISDIPKLGLPKSYLEKDLDGKNARLLRAVLAWGLEKGYYKWEPVEFEKPDRIVVGDYKAFPVGKRPDEGGRWTWNYRMGDRILAGVKKTRKEMVAFLADLSKTDPPDTDPKVPPDLKTLIQMWVDRPRPRPIKDSTRQVYKGHAERMLKSLGNPPVGDLYYGMEERITAVNSKNHKGNAGEGARKLFTYIMNWAVEQKWVDPNKKPPAPKPEPPETPDNPEYLSGLLDLWVHHNGCYDQPHVLMCSKIVDILGDLPITHLRLGHLPKLHGCTDKSPWIYRKALEWAVAVGWTDQSTVDSDEIPPTPEPEPEPPTLDEIVEPPEGEPPAGPDLGNAVVYPPPGPKTESVYVYLSPLEREYIMYRLAQPDQTLESFIEELIVRDVRQQGAFPDDCAVPVGHMPMVSYKLMVDEETWLLMVDRRDGVLESEYVRGLVHIAMYGAPIVRAARQRGQHPEQILRTIATKVSTGDEVTIRLG